MGLVTGGLVLNKVFFQFTASYNTEPWFVVSNHVTTLAITILTSLATLLFNSEVQAKVLALVKPKKNVVTVVAMGALQH